MTNQVSNQGRTPQQEEDATLFATVAFFAIAVLVFAAILWRVGR